MSLKVGDKAPVFTLKNQDGKDVSLNDYKNKNIVILFFPFANSSVCTIEMGIMKNNLKKFEDLNTQILGISIDSPYALKMWAEKHNFNFPLLSDFNKEVSPLYDSLYDVFAPGKYDYKGVSKRSAFIVDKSGFIKYSEICESPSLQPNYDAIENTIRKIN